MLTRVGARCRQSGGRSAAALCALSLSAACAVDSLDRLGAGNALGAPDAGSGPALNGPLRPGSLALDAGSATVPAQLDPALPPLDDAGSGLPSASSELLPDPGFEHGHAGWFGLGDSRIIDVLAAHGGERAILSTNRTTSWDGPAYEIQSLVQPWRAYAVSAWVRNELDTQMVMLTLKAVCNGTPVYARLATRVVATEWLQLTSGFLVPECSEGLEGLTLYVEGPPAFKNLFVDDVSLRQVTLSGSAEAADSSSDGGGSAGETSSPSSSGGSMATATTTASTTTASTTTASTTCSGSSSGNAASNGNASNNPSCNGNGSE